MSDSDVERWLSVARPIAPQTCVACGGVSLRGFVYCGWCGAPMRDETRIAELPTVPEVRASVDANPPDLRPAAVGYAAAPVDFSGSEKITLVHWPADGEPTREITNPSAPIRVGGAEIVRPRDDTRPRGRTQDDQPGLCVVVLGSGAFGHHQPPSDVQILAAGDELDVITHESGTTTSFRVEVGGLRVTDVGAARSVCRLIVGPALLRNGDELRIGQTWLAYARHEGREAWGTFGRMYVLAPSGHVITHYEVGEAGLVLGSALGDPTLSFDAHVGSRHCRVVAGPGGATVEPLEGAAVFVALVDNELLGTGSIACFAETAVRLDPIQ